MCGSAGLDVRVKSGGYGSKSGMGTSVLLSNR